MKKYEYKTMTYYESGLGELDDWLNHQGSEGWELVEFKQLHSSDDEEYVFKKEILTQGVVVLEKFDMYPPLYNTLPEWLIKFSSGSYTAPPVVVDKNPLLEMEIVKTEKRSDDRGIERLLQTHFNNTI